MFDALQKPGTTAPGIGVRQWHRDAHARNIFASADSLTLIDYGTMAWCCDDARECAVNPGFEDVKIKPCKKLPTAVGTQYLNFDAGSMQMICFMLRVVLRGEF